jgi:hypothetical protein
MQNFKRVERFAKRQRYNDEAFHVATTHVVTTHESNVAAAVAPILQNFSDEEKWMYLAFINEMRILIAWESEYDCYWMDHVYQTMIGCDPETLIERLIERQKYHEAFHVATGSSLFCFSCQES